MLASELVAGRELDALVAERVMGWAVDREHKYGTYRCGTFTRDDNTKVGFPPSDTERKRYKSVPHYSTDISHAWQVVERLRTLGWLVRVQEMPDGFPYRDDMTGEPTFTALALCLLYPVAQREAGVRHVREHRAMADSTPLAICRAALAAMEKD